MTETIREARAVRDDAPGVTATDWALVRACLIPLGTPGPAARSYAALADRLHAAAEEQDRLRPGLEGALYELVATADAGQRAILLPLRRSIHNGRRPAPGHAAAARSLGIVGVIPRLARWLDLADEIADLAARLTTRRFPALTERRADLARQAGSESAARAAAAVSSQLHDAVVRYAASEGHPDRRSVKSEPTVLRHVLRATTKTVPLSWFVGVGWSPGASADAPGPATAITRPDLVLVQELLDQSLLDIPVDERPLNVVPGSHLELSTGRFVFPRRGSAGRSERLSLPATPLLREVWTRVDSAHERHGHPLTATALTRELPGVDASALRAFVARLVELGALEHTCGVEPSDLQGAQRWLAQVAPSASARALAGIVADTAAFAAVPAAQRPATVGRLARSWVCAGARSPGQVLTEDVVLAGDHASPVDRSTLIALAPLAEVFDAFPLLRRVQRHRFVATYGRGGVCSSLAEYARTYDAAWTDPSVFDDPALRGDEAANALRLARNRIDELADRWTGPGGIVDTWIGDAALGLAARSLPAQIRARPASHAWFVQCDDAGGLTVNQIYGGWGRFTSRFLDDLPDAARDAVRESIVSGLGPAARPAQIRPLGGFAANVHPLVVDAEVVDSGRSARAGDLRLADIEVVHDLATDDIRLRRRGAREWLDVVYLGFLVPMLLPAHLRAIVNDLGSGLVDLGALGRTVTISTPLGDLAATGRVQCGTTVLARRHWSLGAGQVSALQRLLADESTREVAVARLRVAAGWPRALFVGSAPSALGGTLPATAAFTTRMSSQRSQFVDLADPLHLHVLRKTLARYAGGLRVEEAWPLPTADEPTREYVVETYRRAGGKTR